LLCLIVCASWQAHAFNDPAQGRWLSRDPIEESGGKNLFSFVRNDSTSHFDARGLYPTTSFYMCWPSCNGRWYNPIRECCCNGKIISKKPVPTGIETVKWTGTMPGPSGYPYHTWLRWPGGSLDNNAIPGTYHVSSPAAGPALYVIPVPEVIPLKLSPCSYDFDKLLACMASKAASLQGTSDSRDCDKFAAGIIAQCQEESKGCTSK
jgi:hypothetical protein